MHASIRGIRLLVLVSLIVAGSLVPASEAWAQQPNKLFIWIDFPNAIVQVDIDRDVITDYKEVPTGALAGCQVGPRGRRVYAADFAFDRILVLKSSKRRLRIDPQGPNPIPLSVAPEDMALTQKGRYLIAASNGFQGAATVNLRTRNQTSVTAATTNSIATCGNYALATRGGNTGITDLYRVRGRGQLAGPIRSHTAPGGVRARNVHVAPDCSFGITLEIDSPSIYPFNVPRMAPLGRKFINLDSFSFLLHQAISPDGERYYLQTDAGELQAYRLENGRLKRIWSARTGLDSPIGSTFGADSLYHHPTEDKLYVLRGSQRRLSVFDSKTGAKLKDIVDLRLRNDQGGLCGLPGNF